MIREPYIGMPIHLGCSPAQTPGRPGQSPQRPQPDSPQRPETMPRPETPPSSESHGFDARLLGSLPIAMAYVPMQQWKTTYSQSEALVRGTLFPELDLPFEGRTMR